MSQHWIAGLCVRTALVGGTIATVLTACGGGGGSSGGSTSQMPVAQIATIRPDTPTTEADVVFEAGSSDAANSYEWRFGDGASGSGRQVAHRYKAPGSFEVTLAVTNPQGLRNMASATVVLSPLPISAAINAIPNPKPRLTETVEVSGTGTGQPPLQFQWYDNGRFLGASASSRFAHQFYGLGQHTLTLTVVDSTGRSASASTTVAVGALLPTAAILPGPSRGIVDSAVFLQAQDANGVVRYTWDFGDGSPVDEGPQVTHAFAKPGLYPVTLSAWNADGEVARATVTMDIHHPPPSVQIETRYGAPLVRALDETQQLRAKAIGLPPMSYSWRFSDGGTAAQAEVQHRFSTPGVHHAKVEVTDGRGEKASAELSLQIGPARFDLLTGTEQPLRLQAGQGVQFLSEPLPSSLLCQADGSLLFTGGAVFKLDPQGRVLPFAGAVDMPVESLSSGPFGDVRFMRPKFMVRDPDGVPYVEDLGGVWRLGAPAATFASMNGAIRMDAVDRQGRVWYRSHDSAQIWRYDLGTGSNELVFDKRIVTETNGVREEVRLFDPRYLTFSPKGELYILDRTVDQINIFRQSTDGRVQLVQSLPRSLTFSLDSSNIYSNLMEVDASGTIFFLDQGFQLHVLRAGSHRVIPIGTQSRFGQLSACPHPSGRTREVAVSLEEGEFKVDIERGTLRKLRGHVSDFANPTGPYRLIGADAQGQVYAARGSALGKIDAQGRFQAWVGDPTATGDADGIGPTARFNALWQGTITPQGEAWGLDYSKAKGLRLRHIDSAGRVTSFPLGEQGVNVVLANAAGDAVLVGETMLQTVTRDGARTQRPLPGGYRIELAVMNREGTLYFKYGCAIYQQTSTGPLTLLAGRPDGNFGDCRHGGFVPVDGTGVEAFFGPMTAMAIDTSGTVYVADGEGLRSISPSGQVKSVASVFLRLPDANGAALVEARVRPWAMVALPSGEMVIQSNEMLLKSSGLAPKPVP